MIDTAGYVSHDSYIGTAADQTAPRKKKQVEPRKSSPSSKTAVDHVAAIVTAASAGVTIAELAKETGYEKSKLYGLVYKLKKKGVTFKAYRMESMQKPEWCVR